jgi:PTH1 family peptidyl-tRNA hydrolase
LPVKVLEIIGMSYTLHMLIFGLGNPGDEYLKTRHNAGFLFADYLYDCLEVQKSWQFDKYINAETSTLVLPLDNGSKNIINVFKPQTFMNMSGSTVSKVLERYKNTKPQDIYVAHDDLDILLGDFKVTFGKGPKKHNGLISISDKLSSQEFYRIRVGVENRQGNLISGQDFVLSNFKTAELETLNNIVFSKIIEVLKETVSLGIRK